MPSASSIIQNDTNYTEQMIAKTDTVTGSASATLTSSEFLNLMLKQLQFQDPMDPQDNSEFVSQQCQFSQLQQTTEMGESVKQNNAIMQTLTMVGKEVDLVNPDDPKLTITGTVKEAKFTSNGASIVVNDKTYPISLIKTVRTGGTTPTPTPTPTPKTTT